MFVEADYQIKEPDRDADSGSPDAQRQVFLTHCTFNTLYLTHLANALSSESKDPEEAVRPVQLSLPLVFGRTLPPATTDPLSKWLI